MAPLPASLPETDRRWVLRVSPDPTALRHLRLLAGPGAGWPARRSARHRSRGPRDRAGHRRDRLPAPAIVRQAPHDHRARARPRAEGQPRPGRRRRGDGRDPAARALRRADRMSRPTTELTHLFRQLKAPAAARALPKLADRARAEEWSYEQFAAVLLKTETDSRDSHGGQARIKAARFPARKTLEEFDFAFQTSVRRDSVLHLGQLDFLAGKENVVLLGPARDRQDAPLDRAGDPRLPRRAPRAVQDRDGVGRDARRRSAPRPPGSRARQAATRSAADRRRGRLHPV